MKFPAGEPPSRLLATACRKPLSEVDPLLPPRAVIRLSKLVCSVASAVLAEVPEVESALAVESLLDVKAVPDAEQLLELAPEIADEVVLCEPEVSACDCRAAIKLTPAYCCSSSSRRISRPSHSSSAPASVSRNSA